jgi:hypothetical protein
MNEKQSEKIDKVKAVLWKEKFKFSLNREKFLEKHWNIMGNIYIHKNINIRALLMISSTNLKI